MGMYKFTKKLVHARDIDPESMPPVVGFGKVVQKWDDLMAGIPKQPLEVFGEQPEKGNETKK